MDKDDFIWAIEKVRKEGHWNGGAGITFNQLTQIVTLADKRHQTLLHRDLVYLDKLAAECTNPND